MQVQGRLVIEQLVLFGKSTYEFALAEPLIPIPLPAWAEELAPPQEPVGHLRNEMGRANLVLPGAWPFTPETCERAFDPYGVWVQIPASQLDELELSGETLEYLAEFAVEGRDPEFLVCEGCGLDGS